MKFLGRSWQWGQALSQWMSVLMESSLVDVLSICSNIALSNFAVPLGVTLMGSRCVCVCVGGDGEEGRKIQAFTAPHYPNQNVGVTLVTAVEGQGREHGDGGLQWHLACCSLCSAKVRGELLRPGQVSTVQGT